MWVVRWSDSQRDAVMLLLDAQGELGPSLTGAREGLDLARRTEAPRPTLDWDAVERLASQHSMTQVDAFELLADGARIKGGRHEVTEKGWEVRLTDSQRDALTLLLEAQGELGPSLAGAREELDLGILDTVASHPSPGDGGPGTGRPPERDGLY